MNKPTHTHLHTPFWLGNKLERKHSAIRFALIMLTIGFAAGVGVTYLLLTHQ